MTGRYIELKYFEIMNNRVSGKILLFPDNIETLFDRNIHLSEQKQNEFLTVIQLFAKFIKTFQIKCKNKIDLTVDSIILTGQLNENVINILHYCKLKIKPFCQWSPFAYLEVDKMIHKNQNKCG